MAPATLRTWDRRYGLGPTEHRAGAHRRYTADDVARLLIMRQLTIEGVAPVDAARAALAAGPEELAAQKARAAAGPVPAGDVANPARAGDPSAHGTSARFAAVGAGVGGAGVDAAEDVGAAGAAPGGPDSTEPAASAGRPGPAGQAGPPAPADAVDEPRGEAVDRRRNFHVIAGGEGGASGATNVPRVPGHPTKVSDVVDAAIAYDQRTCDRLLRLAPGEDPGAWWSELVEPALDRLAERTVLARPGEVPEIVLANATLAALREYSRDAEEATVRSGGPSVRHPSRMRRIVLIFVPPEESIPLAVHALAAALGAHNATGTIVTGPVSRHRTLELVTMVRPAAVAMMTTQTRPDLGLVRDVHDANPDLQLFVSLLADDVADEIPLAPTVHRVRSFPGLLHELLAVVR